MKKTEKEDKRKGDRKGRSYRHKKKNEKEIAASEFPRFTRDKPRNDKAQQSWED